MLNTNALTTYERVRDSMGLEDDKQDFIEEAINSASSMIETFCNRRFEKGVYTDIVLEAEDEHLFSQYPVHRVVSINQEPVDEQPLVDIEAGIMFDALSARSRISYEAGYILPRYDSQLEPADLPADIELACKLLVQFIYGDDETESEMSMDSSIKSFESGDLKVALASNGNKATHVIPERVQAMLLKHRKVNL